MTEHPSIRSRTGNVVFVGFGGRASWRVQASRPQGRTCCSCAHWCGDQGGDADAMLDAGVYLAPSAFEAGFVSAAHTDDDIAQTIHAAERAFGSI